MLFENFYFVHPTGSFLPLTLASYSPIALHSDASLLCHHARLSFEVSVTKATKQSFGILTLPLVEPVMANEQLMCRAVCKLIIHFSPRYFPRAIFSEQSVLVIKCGSFCCVDACKLIYSASKQCGSSCRGCLYKRKLHGRLPGRSSGQLRPLRNTLFTRGMKAGHNKQT